MKDQKKISLFVLIQAVRDFFNQNNFLDVITPPMVENPGMEVHIHPFEVFTAKDGKSTGKYLHTSPEFYMKELLSHGHQKIFTIGHSFRDEIKSPIHRSQFLMLEWYRANSRYEQIMDDCENLIKFCLTTLTQKNIPINKNLLMATLTRMTVAELFQKYLAIDILNYLEVEQIKKLIKNSFKDIYCPENEEMEWDDYFFLIFLNKIEPHLKEIPYLLLYEYPYHLSALSTLKSSDPRVCERFEIYINGVELCNCFNELCDLKIQKERFQGQSTLKKNLYGYTLPEPTVLFSALERGIPPSAGVAMGIERLLLALTGEKNIFGD